MLNKGDIIEATVESFALPECVGVVRHQNWVIFVPNVLPGEKCRVKIVKAKKNFLQGELIDLLEVSPSRIEPCCPHFNRGCGGCSLQNINYPEQIAIKEKNALDTLIRIGKVDLSAIDYQGFLPSPQIFGYRNKMEFNFGEKNGNLVCGLRPKGKYWDIIDLKSCYLMDTYFIQALLDFFCWYGKQHGLTGYDPVRKDGVLRNLLVRYNQSSDQYFIGLSTVNHDLPGANAMIGEVTRLFPKISGIIHIINNSPASALIFEEKKLLYGSDFFIESIGSIRYKISIDSFFQVNIHAGEFLFPKVAEYVDLQPGESLFDLYSGNGSIGLFLSRPGTRITGVDENPQAVEDALYNAQLNSIDSYFTICGRVEKVLAGLTNQPVSKIVVDPPRAGLVTKVIDAIVHAFPKRIVYVSCNTSSLARDIAVFKDNGYVLKKITWIDLFPQTPHFEAVALIEPSGK